MNLWQLYIFNWFFLSTNSTGIVRLHTLPAGTGLIFFYPLMYLLLLKLEWNKEGKGMWWIFDKERVGRAICQRGFLSVFSCWAPFSHFLQELLCDLCLVKKNWISIYVMKAGHLRCSIKQIQKVPEKEGVIILTVFLFSPFTLDSSYHVRFCPSITHLWRLNK